MANPGPASTSTPIYLMNGGSTDGDLIALSGGKVGFYGTTPVVQASAVAVPTDLTTTIASVTALITALKNLGLTA
jgi:hypothetical protein